MKSMAMILASAALIGSLVGIQPAYSATVTGTAAPVGTTSAMCTSYGQGYCSCNYGYVAQFVRATNCTVAATKGSCMGYGSMVQGYGSCCVCVNP
jgi:hypothetical protein